MKAIPQPREGIDEVVGGGSGTHADNAVPAQQRFDLSDGRLGNIALLLILWRQGEPMRACPQRPPR